MARKDRGDQQRTLHEAFAEGEASVAEMHQLALMAAHALKTRPKEERCGLAGLSIMRTLINIGKGCEPVNWTNRKWAYELLYESERCVSRVVAVLVRHGLVTRHERADARGARTRNGLTFNAGGAVALLHRLRTRCAPPDSGVRDDSGARNRSRVSQGGVTHESGGGDSRVRAYKEYLPSSSSLFPSPPDAGGWEGVVEVLGGELGIKLPEQAIAAARAAGADPREAFAVIEHWRGRRGAWGQGALFARLTRLRPGQDPSAAWPPPDAAWQRRQDAQRAADASAADAERVAERRAAVAAERAQLAAWAEEFGDEADASSDAELAARGCATPPVALPAALRREWFVSELARLAGGVSEPVTGESQA